MSNYDNIRVKLARFIKKYYTDILLRGVVVFISVGALIFMIFLGVEYFLWLGSTGRFILLWLLVIIELFLLFRNIVIPIFYILKLKKGIDEKQASKIIGNHFPEVEDKLFNLFDLKDNSEQSELLIASIEQRSMNFVNLDFAKAVTYTNVSKVVKFLIVPVVVIGLLWVTGNVESFFGAYERVINYSLAYEEPRPFSFRLISDDLTVYENADFDIRVGIEGKVRPEQVYIQIEGRNYLMQEINGVFGYTIKSAVNSQDFLVVANEVKSKSYTLRVLETPSIIDFNLYLEYPKYTKRVKEKLRSVGNAIIPEGTRVTWKLNTLNTDKVVLKTKDSVLDFENSYSHYSLSKIISRDMDYFISTSNDNIQNYENLGYGIKVVKDAYPTMNIVKNLDSLEPNKLYFKGDVADDYGLNKLEIVYYPSDNWEKRKRTMLLSFNSLVDQFYYTYPSGLDLDQDVEYSFYFDLSDNDGVNGSKHTRSEIFTNLALDSNQLEKSVLQKQQGIVAVGEKSLDGLKSQSKALNEINKEQIEKGSLNFKDKQKISKFLDKQELQEMQMQKFSKQLKENLQNLNKDDELNKLLQERLERQDIEAEKNRKMLEELQDIAEKMNREKLAMKLEEIAKSQKNSQRNLEQLLELTKRYYITEKASQLAKDLDELSKRQEGLANKKSIESDTKEVQSELNKEFQEISKELEELEKDNQDLKKRISLDFDKDMVQSIKSNQNKASELLNKQEQTPTLPDLDSEGKMPNAAMDKQKAAAKQMMQLSEKLMQSSSGSSIATMTEDAEMLRQILDNLIVFTLKQESLMNGLDRGESSFSNHSRAIMKQQSLKRLFGHIDDSLFSLSLRVPEISENINKEIGEVYYNIDKALGLIAESNVNQVVSHQKYVLTAGNELSDLMASALDNMQSSMKMGNGEGSGSDFQLPDIIKAQGEINGKLGKQGKDADGGKQGRYGEKGEGQGNNGSEQKSGQSGEDAKKMNEKRAEQSRGENGSKGEGGDQGESGKGEEDGAKNGSGKGSISEAGIKEIYEIYKQQEELKQNLESQLKNMLDNSDRKLGEKLINQMSDFQKDLLENGVTKSNVEKAAILEYELLKLEGASMKQGEREERESFYNDKNYQGTRSTKPKGIDVYKNQNEILNRQVLPMRQSLQIRVNDYFRGND